MIWHVRKAYFQYAEAEMNAPAHHDDYGRFSGCGNALNALPHFVSTLGTAYETNPEEAAPLKGAAALSLSYIDESGFSEGMPKIFGCAPAGVRCFGEHGWMPKRRTDVADD